MNAAILMIFIMALVLPQLCTSERIKGTHWNRIGKRLEEARDIDSFEDGSSIELLQNDFDGFHSDKNDDFDHVAAKRNYLVKLRKIFNKYKNSGQQFNSINFRRFQDD